MHRYRLTRRGKYVLTILVMLVGLVGTRGFRNTAIASDKFEYAIQYMNSYSDKSDLYELSLNEIAIEHSNNIVELNEESLEEKEEFLSIDIENIRTYNESKIAFLTFDDGPSKNVTPEILDILEHYNIKATFFVLGNMCEKNGDVLQRVADEGHAIGIHSYSHQLNELLASQDSFINEINLTENAIKKSLGEEFNTRLFRFPGGSFESYKQQYMEALNERGYVSVDWNALTGDSEHLKPTTEILLERLKATTINKDNIVVLMHDSENKHVAAEVLPDVIEHLILQGYEFAVLK